MQCGIEEKTIRSVRVVVECFKCGEEGHKCRVCLQRKKKEYRSVYLARGKAQGCREKEVRRVEEKAARSVKGEVQQGKWKRSLWKMLRKRAE